MIHSKNARILLEGPSSCGKTSLAMGFALHLSETAVPFSKSRAVWFLTPTKSKEEMRFPLPCRPKEQLSSSSRDTDNQWSEKDYASLEKIQVKYLDSISDLIFTLATIESLAPSDQPSRAIIIDDFDLFLQPSDTNSSASDVMKLTQLCILF